MRIAQSVSMPLRASCLSFVLPLAMLTLVTAQSSAAVPHRPAPTTVSYGSYIVAVDAAVVASAITLESESVLIAGYLLNGPIFHIGHGRVGQAFGSLVLRAALPSLGMLAGLAIGSGESEVLGASDGEVMGFGIGGVLGIIAASTIDGLLLARYTVAEGDDQRRGIMEVGGVSASPTIARTPCGRWRFGLAGTF